MRFKNVPPFKVGDMVMFRFRDDNSVPQGPYRVAIVTFQHMRTGGSVWFIDCELVGSEDTDLWLFHDTELELAE